MCPCGGGPCSEDDYGGEWMTSYDINGGGSMQECGDCKGDCADADSETTPAGTCKGQCMDTFGTNNCPCGSINTRCIEGDESSHSHDGDSSSDDGLLNTDACGNCKRDCAAADPPSDDCKSNCMNTFGWDACPCGDGRCSEDDHGGEWNSFYDTVQPCWDCKVACSDADSDATPAGDCKEQCMNTFGYDQCPCGGGPCTEDSYGEDWMTSYDINGGGSMQECGDCKGDCADADSEATPAGTCKGQCMDTFGTNNCPCGNMNTRCIVGDESSHSHDGDSSSDDDDDLLNTDACGACKSSCSTETPEFIETEEESCKGQCMNNYGWDACPCGDGRCSEDDHGE